MHCPQGSSTERHLLLQVESPHLLPGQRRGIREETIWGVVLCLQTLKSDLDQEKAPCSLVKLLFHWPWCWIFCFSFRDLCVYVLVPESCPTLCNSMDYRPPGSSVHGIFQARILEWGAISSSSGIFPTQGLNSGLLHWGQILYHLSNQGSPFHGHESFPVPQNLSPWKHHKPFPHVADKLEVSMGLLKGHGKEGKGSKRAPLRPGIDFPSLPLSPLERPPLVMPSWDWFRAGATTGKVREKGPLSGGSGCKGYNWQTSDCK